MLNVGERKKLKSVDVYVCMCAPFEAICFEK